MGNKLMFDITTTFLELGDSTSRNLEFSHRDDVFVSYGEETITEINLLEIRRRHPGLIHLQTFTKPREAQNGADWEWHIVGRKYTFKMRVQAKRLQSNCILKVNHKVRSSSRQQRELLIEKASNDNIKAVYCIYCTEPQRKLWKEKKASLGYRSIQTGCLLADALDVPLTVRNLDVIEEKCIPWHYLFCPPRSRFDIVLEYLNVGVGDPITFISHKQLYLPAMVSEETELPDSSGWNPPTIEDLNEDTGRDFDRIGVEETTEKDLARLEPNTERSLAIAQLDENYFKEKGIYRMLVMDVRGNTG